jgi:surface polysaccharide O-acyltransferase-like enzyme
MLGYIHKLRGLSMAWVVLAHAKLLVIWSEHAPAHERLLHSVIEGADVPFVVVAGFLFQLGAERFHYPTYLRARWRGVIVPYLVCSLPVLLHAFVFRYGIFEGRVALYEPGMASAVIHALLTGAHMLVPLWFIPTIAVFYLASPLLVWIDRRPRIYALIPPLLIAGALLHQAPFYNNVFRDALQLLPAWLLGMALCRFREPVFAELRRKPLRLPLAIALLIAADVAFGNGVRIGSLSPFSTESGWLDLPYLQKALFAVFALERLAAHETQRAGKHDRLGWTLSQLGDLSLGIFFVHMYVLNWFLRPGWKHFAPLPHAGWLPILGFFLVLLAITVGLVLAIRRVLGPRSRTLIGC